MIANAFFVICIKQFLVKGVGHKYHLHVDCISPRLYFKYNLSTFTFPAYLYFALVVFLQGCFYY